MQGCICVFAHPRPYVNIKNVTHHVVGEDTQLYGPGLFDKLGASLGKLRMGLPEALSAVYLLLLLLAAHAALVAVDCGRYCSVHAEHA